MKNLKMVYITPSTVAAESYYNCLRLCTLLGYANPVEGMRADNLSIAVYKDDCGNIVKLG